MTLEQRVKNLEKSVLQMQKNMTPLFAKADETASDVKTITPYTATKQHILMILKLYLKMYHLVLGMYHLVMMLWLQK